MNDKRNPSVVRGDGETSESYSGRLKEFVSRIRWQSEGHRMWYTHKNPSGCWICELLQICDLLLDEMLVDGGDDYDDAQSEPESDERDLD